MTTIEIPVTAEPDDVARLLASLGIHGIDPHNVTRIDDEGDCWAVRCLVMREDRRGLVRRHGEPQTVTVRCDKVMPAWVAGGAA